MFDNIGGKIKTLAKVICWIGIIVSIIAGIVAGVAMGSGSGVLVAILIIVIGALCSWIGSFLLYGFGELIDNTKKIEENTRKEAPASAPAAE